MHLATYTCADAVVHAAGGKGERAEKIKRECKTRMKRGARERERAVAKGRGTIGRRKERQRDRQIEREREMGSDRARGKASEKERWREKGEIERRNEVTGVEVRAREVDLKKDRASRSTFPCIT